MPDIGAYKDKRGRQLDLAQAAVTSLAGAASNGQTDVVLVDNPGTGKRIRLFGVVITSGDDAVQAVSLFSADANGANNVTLAIIDAQPTGAANPGVVWNFFGGVALPENKQLEFVIPEASIVTVHVSVEYVIENIGDN